METRCYRCGATMQPGHATALGLMGGSAAGKPKLVFVVPGEPTSSNLIQAFQQGLADAKTADAFLLEGHRCPSCGLVELVATEKTAWEP